MVAHRGRLIKPPRLPRMCACKGLQEDHLIRVENGYNVHYCATCFGYIGTETLDYDPNRPIIIIPLADYCFQCFGTHIVRPNPCETWFIELRTRFIDGQINQWEYDWDIENRIGIAGAEHPCPTCDPEGYALYEKQMEEERQNLRSYIKTKFTKGSN